jgi:hypothetical protein
LSGTFLPKMRAQPRTDLSSTDEIVSSGKCLCGYANT